MLGVGARAAARARAAGRPTRLVWDAHEFLPGLRSWRDNARWLPANCAHERVHAPAADAVVTISEELADLLREEHNLTVRPTVVLNAPTVATPPGEAGAPVRDLRADCGVGPDTPLVVYSGGITRVRGVDTTIEALVELPGVHLALVSVAPGARPDGYVADLLAHAERLGVADRVHLLPFVPYWQVYAYLSAADAAVSGLSHLQNHEIALSNKFFEYAHARLPVVVSDVRTMAATVRETGQGEVFRAGDPADLARALRLVLDDPKRYRDAYERPGMLEGWSWDTQAAVLDRVYTDLVPNARPSQRAAR
jgi:glycosyltransferase involved in cell wall biosynthesis